MGFVNKVMLLGNTTREPELRTLPSGTTVCDFGLATNRVYKTTAGEERQETVFVDCTAFGRTGEVIAEYCPKGRSLFVEGRLHFNTWEDATGAKRSKLSVIVESFQFVGGQREGGAGPAQQELPLNAQAADRSQQRRAAPPATKIVSAGAPRRGEERQTEPTHVDAGSVQTAERSGRAAAAAAKPSRLRAPGAAHSTRADGARRDRLNDPKAVDRMAEESESVATADVDLPF